MKAMRSSFRGGSLSGLIPRGAEDIAAEIPLRGLKVLP